MDQGDTSGTVFRSFFQGYFLASASLFGPLIFFKTPHNTVVFRGNASRQYRRLARNSLLV